MNTITCLLYLLSVIISVNGLKTRIYGGLEAPEGRFPYYAYLSTPRGAGTFCGGSIIHKRWILTAAHCFQRENIERIVVRVGSILRSGRDGTIYSVEKKIDHEAFNEVGNINDIALLRVDKDIEFNAKVQLIPLATKDMKKYDNKRVIIAGFGEIQNQNLPQKLQGVILNVFVYSDCKILERRIDETQICTFSKQRKGPCKGDSGGPLVNGDGVQIGIDSLAYGPCGEVPEIYTEVASFRNWIDEKIRQN